MVIGQGDIWWADLGEPVGSAPGYRHPVLVVQCDALSTSRIGTVVCVPLTSISNGRELQETYSCLQRLPVCRKTLLRTYR